MKAFFEEWQAFWEAVNVFATGFLAICVALLAREQNHLARTQAKIDALERRLALFDSIMAFVANISIEGTAGPDQLHRMLRDTRHAQFLFPAKAKIRELIEDLYRKGLDLEYAEKAILSLQSPNMNPVLREKISESQELKNWFRAKSADIEAQFRPYLEIAEQ